MEGNFVPAGVKKVDEAGAIKHLIDRFNYTSLDFKFMGDTRVLHQRFLEREKTAERGEVNKIGMDVPYDTFNQWCHNLDSFDIGGETVRVNTTYYYAKGRIHSLKTSFCAYHYSNYFISDIGLSYCKSNLYTQHHMLSRNC